MQSSRLKPFLFFFSTVSALAQTTGLQMNVMYQCPAVQASMKVYSCEGPAANNSCDVETLPQGRPSMRGKATRQQVMALLQICHPQTSAEAQAGARGGNAAAPGVAGGGAAGPGGIKVGETVRVLIDGWGEAKVIGINGNFFRVHLPNGLDVSKMWPYEVHRAGKLTPEDHAAGQYDTGDRVQVLVNGKWMEGNVRGQQDNMYQVKVPGVDTGFGSDIVGTLAQNIRMSNTAPPAPAAKRAAGQVPKAGLTSCGGKYDGRWEMPQGGTRIVFRGGTATFSDPLSQPETYECFVGGGEIQFFKPGEFKETDYMTLLPNNDGTLQSPLGPLKKMGN